MLSGAAWEKHLIKIEEDKPRPGSGKAADRVMALRPIVTSLAQVEGDQALPDFAEDVVS